VKTGKIRRQVVVRARSNRNPTLKGGHAATREGAAYDYEAFWFRTDGRIVWRARIRRDGKLKATPHGVIVDDGTLGQEFAVRNAVTDLVTAAVEYLARMEK
jgi:hypothetical protein